MGSSYPAETTLVNGIEALSVEEPAMGDLASREGSLDIDPARNTTTKVRRDKPHRCEAKGGPASC
ncbi:MAG: hypothetical protein P8K07_16370 [Candidatus Binatia bacterium]|nr:hypothetical protein [Candidatus Binatia bacterium]